MVSEHDRDDRRVAAPSLASAIKELAQVSVEGLHAPNERLSGEHQRHAEKLTQRVAASLRQLTDGDRNHKAALREAVGAATVLFEEHPLSAGQLVALDHDPGRATDALLSTGESTVADLGTAAANLFHERVLPRIIQEMLTDRRLIAELARTASGAASSVTTTLLLTITGHDGAVASAQLSPLDGATVLTASEDTTARLWDAANGQQQLALEGHDAALWNASYSRDGSRVATASHDHTARIWDAASGQHLVTIAGHQDWVRAAAFCGDGTRIVTASYDTTARLWDAASAALVLTMPHADRVADAAFSPDDSRIVTACYDATARIWDATTGQEQLALQGHEREVVSAAFSPDGTRIVTGSHDLTARIWDASNGQHLVTLQGHSEQVRRAGFSPDGTMIVTASDDRSARLWDAVSGLQLAVLDGHADWVFSAAFGPDGSKIVTASSDRTVKVWGCAVRETRRVLVAGQGRIRLPTEFRSALGIEVGDLVVVELGEDMLYLRPGATPG
jgi:WD domain, G-beta repeat/Antidote-toxin recognition MazE, bacterial antitoxin